MELEQIDFLVGMHGWTGDREEQVASLLYSLKKNCNLEGVNVFCVDRQHHPTSDALWYVINHAGYAHWRCPLPQFDTCREDTSQFVDWMMCNVGSGAPWAVVSHFDVLFNGDYISYVRSLTNKVDMVGCYHDGIVAVRREAYHKCKVGFSGIDGICIAYDANKPRIVSNTHPLLDTESMLSMDVGELLVLRMNTLGMKHMYLVGTNGTGKSEFFIHTRNGSGPRR